MAVPAGDYEMTATVDLSPLFGEITHAEEVSVIRPGLAILAKRLEELKSRDRNVRYRALIDLRYFPDHGDRIVPALIALLDDQDASIPSIALSVLSAYPKEAAAHVDRFLEILDGGEGVSVGEKGSAAYLLGRVAPKDEKVEKALVAAVEKADPMRKRRFEYALNLYRKRTGAEAK